MRSIDQNQSAWPFRPDERQTIPVVTIVLYSAQPMLSAGLEVTLAAAPGFRLASICAVLSEVAGQVERTAASLVLIELTPDVTLQALKEIHSGSQSVRIILLADRVSTEFASQAIGAGVRGILRKTLSLKQHLECFQKVAQGEFWLEKVLTEDLLGNQRVWPYESVRALIDHFNRHALEDVVRESLLNKREASTKDPLDGGTLERAFASQYLGWSERLAEACPRTAALLTDPADKERNWAVPRIRDEIGRFDSGHSAL
jgi:DNA-binding NarL/FixJ family response regulator